ncbi:hypothetical protein GCE65_00850 [Pseudactinotalea sp. HY158]|nr:hypothetical protein GCE65_00850 [Pseudactinotalea sp. HY158]
MTSSRFSTRVAPLLRPGPAGACAPLSLVRAPTHAGSCRHRPPIRAVAAVLAPSPRDGRADLRAASRPGEPAGVVRRPAGDEARGGLVDVERAGRAGEVCGHGEVDAVPLAGDGGPVRDDPAAVPAGHPVPVVATGGGHLERVGAAELGPDARRVDLQDPRAGGEPELVHGDVLRAADVLLQVETRGGAVHLAATGDAVGERPPCARIGGRHLRWILAPGLLLGRERPGPPLADRRARLAGIVAPPAERVLLSGGRRRPPCRGGGGGPGGDAVQAGPELRLGGEHVRPVGRLPVHRGTDGGHECRMERVRVRAAGGQRHRLEQSRQLGQARRLGGHGRDRRVRPPPHDRPAAGEAVQEPQEVVEPAPSPAEGEHRRAARLLPLVGAPEDRLPDPVVEGAGEFEAQAPAARAGPEHVGLHLMERSGALVPTAGALDPDQGAGVGNGFHWWVTPPRREAVERHREEAMHTLTLTTQPMTCADCIATIEGVLGRAPGVRHVSVRFSTNQVHVDYNADSIAGSEIAWTLTRLGHPVLSAVEELAAA